jgi:NADH:ubiquinone oxidoreductase subunit 5 (subunit L)/multisubunit Na+/H+ antiporter MnhA subunit
MEPTHVESAVGAVRRAPRRVAQASWIDGLARYGLAAKGVSYALVGALAAALALGAGGKTTSREGALATIADDAWGKVLLVALAVGFAAHALWRLAQALFDREREGSDASGIAKRVGFLGLAVLYGFLTFVSVRLLIGSGQHESQTSQARKAAAHVLDWPAGRWLVAGAGLSLIGAGLFYGYRAFAHDFEEKWRTNEMSRPTRRVGLGIATVGMLAELVVFALIGAFFLKAALEYDPSEAIGLDGALQEVAEASYGPALLGLVAVGLLCYAVFCFFEARYRRV